MNPPPALVAAFVARLDRVLEHLRGELVNAGDAVLMDPSPEWRGTSKPTPEEWAAHVALVTDRMNHPGPGLTGGSGESSREGWPADLPLPLTVADARAAVARDRDRIAADLAEELSRLVAALVPAELRAGALEDPAVLAVWPWPPATGRPRHAGSLALHYLLSRVRELPPGEDRHPMRGDLLNQRSRFPWVFAWARAAAKPFGDGAVSIPMPGDDDGIRVWAELHPGTFSSPPPAALNALYGHLWARSPLFAAVEAARLVRELTAAGDPGPAYLAAVRDALGSYARAVEDPDALALAALEDTPAARARLSGYAVYLLDAARRVAALFAVDAADEDAARATVETPHGPALQWDVAFAGLLTARGDTVRELAAGRWAAVYGPQVPIPDTPRPPPGSLWALWAARDDGPRWLLWLAADLWVSVWRPAAEEDRERERRRGMYSGVPGVLTLAANRALTATFDAARTGELQGEQLVLFAPGRRGELARIELARIDIRIHARLVALLAEAPPAVDALFTLALHRGFERWREMPRDGLGDGELLIDGGKRGLAALLGCGDKDTDYALTWGQCLTLPDIDVKGLWTWNGTYRPAAPGRAAVGMLSIQRALLPGAEQEQTGKGRYFAPWTEEPPLPADRSQRRAALHFWRLLGVRMAELAADGKPPVLPVAVVEHAARQAGETRWQARGDEWSAAGALALAADGWRYGPLYDAERKLLEGNQKVQKSAAKGGRARAANAERGREGVFSPRRKRPK